MIKVSRSIVPNFFTVGNMFCGYMSIVFAVFNHNYVLASWMIVLAAFFDAMDGKIARFINTSSKFGVEYDSLADVVSFGLAPSVLIYAFFFSDWKTVGLFISFFPLLFASIRLARFNVQLEGFDKSHFTGLPSPVAAISLATYIIFVSEFFQANPFPKLFITITFILSILMVSTIRYDIMPNLTFKGSRYQKVMFVLLIISFLTLIIFPKALFFPYMMIYVLSGIVRFLIKLGNDSLVKD
ncbi:MAG: CDP-diacylglycerol--serine O-phosphatidyltransferase [Calditrichales bacterium]|nr:CDP-diacylglycerol--serine O-phosphatidyltransferase [Calditrichales bacterium]